MKLTMRDEAVVENPIGVKLKLKASLEAKLPKNSTDRARKDWHARRRPRPCGLTVHPGIGCTGGCVYCYVPELGFDMGVAVPYGLTGLELVYALLCNPYFVPGGMGTFLAFGSVTDPFLPGVREKSLEYAFAVKKRLGNPVQMATKQFISEELASHLGKRFERGGLNVLITIVAKNNWKRIEPNVASYEQRIETIRNLTRHGLKASLFLRPLLPFVDLEEVEEILRDAKEAGAFSVVAGSLMVNDRILKRMKKAGLDTSLVRKRIVGPLNRRLRSIRSRDLKKDVENLAKELGLLFFNSACCSLAYASGVPCWGICWTSSFCVNCPNACREKVPNYGLDEVNSMLNLAFPGKATVVDMDPESVKVRLADKGVKEAVRVLLRTITRRIVSFA